MKVADFNRDGRPDLAVANSGSNTISLLFGTGAGGFTLGATVPAGRTPFALAIADFNRDGKVDIAEANNGDGSIVVLLGDGAGGFTTASTILPRLLAVNSLETVDVNEDFKPDLVITSALAVSVFLGRGDGTFGPQSEFPAGREPTSATPGDFNNDGRVDLAVANPSSIVSILLGHGDGTFGLQTSFPAGATGRSQITGEEEVAAADFNGDGRVDLAIGIYTDNNVSVFLGAGDGTFVLSNRYPVQYFPVSVAVADVNGDRVPDIVAANFNSDSISVLFGAGDGTFAPSKAFPAGFGAGSIAIADLNADGQNDVAVADIFSNNVSVLIGQPCLADLRLTTTTNAPPHYTSLATPLNIVVNNDGPDDAAAVTVTDVLPASLVLISANPSQGTCTGTSTVTCNLGSLANGATATVALTVRILSPGVVTNSATVTAASHDPNVSNNSSTISMNALSLSAIPALDGIALLALGVALTLLGVGAIRRSPV